VAQKFVSTYDQINNSRRNSIIVVGIYILLFAVLFAAIGFFAGGGATYDISAQQLWGSVILGGLLGLLISFGISLYTYKNSGKILAKAANAREIQREESPFLYETVESVAVGAGILPPKPYIIETGELNAFASGTGKGNSMVAVTRGLLETMNREELEGVIAHEVAHLKNDDIKIVSLVAALSATLLLVIRMLSRGFFFSGRGRSGGGNSRGGGGNAVVAVVMIVLAVLAMILAPLIVKAMQSAVSKQREYLADASGAAIIGYPLGLASALEKIKQGNDSYLETNKTAFENTSVHALCISAPTIKKISNIFSTHPPIDERIRRLRQWNA
jgi:heat shock protein HtpX